LLVAIAREMASKIANRVTDVIFPPKVLSKRDKQITINRGDGTDITVGQIWNAFAIGEELIDPDTRRSPYWESKNYRHLTKNRNGRNPGRFRN